MLCEEPLRVVGQFEKRYALVQVRPISVPVPFDIAPATILLLAPLVRHLLKEGRVDQPIKFVGIHRVNTIVEAFAFGFEARDRLRVFAALLGVARMKGVTHPFEHVVIEMESPKQIGELLLKRLLSHVPATACRGVASTFVRVAGAMVINVSFLLDLSDDRAAARGAFDQTREGEIASPGPRSSTNAPVENVLNPFP